MSLKKFWLKIFNNQKYIELKYLEKKENNTLLFKKT